MSMKDLLSKMTELQGTIESVEVAPVATTSKKVLNESSNTIKESTKPSLKSIFSSLLSEAEQVTIQPAKQNTQVIKQGQKTLGTVENPQLAQQIKQSIGKGEMSLAGDELNEVEDEIDSTEYEADVYDGDDYDDDDGSDQYATELNGLHLGDVVKAYYNGKAVIGKINELYPTNMEVELELTGRNTGKTIVVDIRDIDVDNLNESKLTEKAVSKSQQQAAGAALAAKRGDTSKSKLTGASKEMAKMPAKELEKFAKTKHKGLPDKKTEEVNEVFKFPGGTAAHQARVNKAIDKDKASAAKKKAADKQKSLPDKKEKTDEAAMPTHDGDFGAGLGAGRSQTTLESSTMRLVKQNTSGSKSYKLYKDTDWGEYRVKFYEDGKHLTKADYHTDDKQDALDTAENFLTKTVSEAKAKPDFLDLDKDGNKKESMKKAAADKQKVPTMKKTNEAKKAKPDFLDLDKDGDKKESMKKAATDKKTGPANKKGLTAAQKKLPAGLQKAVAKKEPVKEGRIPKVKVEKQLGKYAVIDDGKVIKTYMAKYEADEHAAMLNDKKAAADAKKKVTVKEGTNPTEAARLLGKAHAMANDTFSCKYEEGSQEAQAYLDGYKSGLDECYGSGGGMGMQQDIGMMPGMNSMVSMNDTPSLRGGSEFEVDSMDDMGGFGGFDSQSDDTDMMAFEAWDRQLNELLNEGKMKDIDIDMKQMTDAEFKKEHGKSKADMKKDLSSDAKKPVKEGISVSVSKGQQGSPDSVTVSAQDSDADALLAMIKQAGLGLFGGDEPSGYGSPASTAATQPVGDVGDHDSMMALIKKMSSTGNDYEDEESMSCDSCDDESDSKALVVGEDETEDQMEFEVSEANAPDSGEAETTADENAEAKEDQALAGAMSGNEEEIDEGSCSMEEDELQENSTEPKWKNTGLSYDEAVKKHGKENVKVQGKDKRGQDFIMVKVAADHHLQKNEEINEWANDAGYEGSENIKDNTFEQDIEFMTRVISGGLNGPKKDQTTLPHTKVKVDESRQAINEWKKLSGIK